MLRIHLFISFSSRVASQLSVSECKLACQCHDRPAATSQQRQHSFTATLPIYFYQVKVEAAQDKTAQVEVEILTTRVKNVAHL